MIRIVFIIIVVAVVFTLAFLFGRRKWSQYVSALSREVATGADGPGERVDLSGIENLPAPVKRYFRHVLQDGRPVISGAVLSQRGGFRSRPGMKGWLAMKADQRFSVQPRGFVWSAEISMMPGVPVNVCDSYIRGRGGMIGRILYLIPVVNESGDLKLSQGALQRYLAEAVWFPTALLPSQGVSWEPVDENRAKATLSDSGITVSLEFEFNGEGEAVSIFTPRRYYKANERYREIPWKGSFSDYMEADGWLVPSRGEVEWHLESGPYPYWRGEIFDIEYDYRE